MSLREKQIGKAVQNVETVEKFYKITLFINFPPLNSVKYDKNYPLDNEM